jgi:hypothetical protein
MLEGRPSVEKSSFSRLGGLAVVRQLGIFFACAVSAAFLLAGAALAQTGPWTVISVEGVVSAAATPNAPIQPIAVGQSIAATAMIVTGLDGRALLDRAGDRIEITPGTRLQLEPQATTTSVLQRAGRVIYDIVTGGKPRFDVRTPFLVAGVKGTVFSVTVTTNGASVSVSEGVVGVSPPTPDGFDGADVTAGSSAAVSVDAGSLSITVEDTPAGRAPESLRDGAAAPRGGQRSAAPDRGTNSAAASGRGPQNGRGNGGDQSSQQSASNEGFNESPSDAGGGNSGDNGGGNSGDNGGGNSGDNGNGNSGDNGNGNSGDNGNGNSGDNGNGNSGDNGNGNSGDNGNGNSGDNGNGNSGGNGNGNSGGNGKGNGP